MLKSPTKPALISAEASHTDIFVQNYDLLKGWALQFTGRDKDLAEDLLHDTFIHFTLSRPDLASIENLEGYLFIVMRNLHLSQLRRATRSPFRSYSAVEYDTADMSFWASDPRDHLRIRDQLAAVCQFACIRKESSKGGSLLILRFFHGYYPDEIALVMHTTRAAVNASLKKVRVETKVYIGEPDRLSFIVNSPVATTTLAPISALSGDLRLEFQRQIFDSCQGECLPEKTLNGLYTPRSEGPDRQTLAHIVSCQTCIENINSLLHLPPLGSRYPLDTIGKDPGKKGGGSGGGSGGAGGGHNMFDSYIGRRDAHFYHEPQELCISVNGQFQGQQRIVSGKGEFMLALDTSESLGFVEVFSELGLRLLMFNVEPPPTGDGKQSAHVELSWGRTIDANLDFSSQSPILQVSYNDPALDILALAQAADITDAPSVASSNVNGRDKEERNVSVLPAVRNSVVPKLTDKLRRISLTSWLQPARLTSAFAVLLIATFVILKFVPFGTPSANDLIARSIEAENARLSDKDRVLHRTLDFDEMTADGQLITRKKIDIYQSSEKGITARRLYDKHGVLTGGDWRSTNGVQTIYARGAQPRLQPLREKRIASLTFDDAWQISASAQDFKSLIASLDKAQVETLPNAYRITYTSGSTEDSDQFVGIVRAAITLNRDDLHVIEQSFVLHQNGETREYHITETSYDWKPSNTVAPAVFEPNIELIGGQVQTRMVGSVPDLSVPPAVAGGDLSNTNSNTTAPTAAIVTPALEVEVVDALNNAGAFMGEQINVARTPDGKLTVTALVETDQRKREILAALNNVRNNPAVRINVETVAEAESRIKRSTKGGQSNQPGSVEQVNVDQNDNAVFSLLKKRFSEVEARRFADGILNRSRSARAHALAAKQIAERFSENDLASLPLAEHERWLAAIRGHAEAFLRETQSLQRELQTLFPEAAVSAGSGGGALTTDREIQTRTRELYQAAISLDQGFERSFASTSETTATPPVSTSGFWRTFASTASLAHSIAAAK
jgi:RNA polymerase sigma factor (sigma-70 family)